MMRDNNENILTVIRSVLKTHKTGFFENIALMLKYLTKVRKETIKKIMTGTALKPGANTGTNPLLPNIDSKDFRSTTVSGNMFQAGSNIEQGQTASGVKSSDHMNLPEVYEPFLPPKTSEHEYTLVLDLDETLIHFVDMSY